MRESAIYQQMTKEGDSPTSNQPPGSVQPDAAHQILKTRVAAQRIKQREDLDVYQNIGLFLVGPLKPRKCLIVVAEPQISIHKGTGRNVASLLALFQFSKEPKCICSSPGVGICPDQRTNNPWAAISYRSRLLQHGNCLFGLLIADERPT